MKLLIGIDTIKIKTLTPVSQEMQKAKNDIGDLYSYISANYGNSSPITHMVSYILDAIKNIDVHIERRNDGGYIIVANALSYRKTRKNVATFWLTGSSVTVIILQKLNRTTFRSVEQMKRKQVAENIISKYHEMTELYV